MSQESLNDEHFIPEYPFVNVCVVASSEIIFEIWDLNLALHPNVLESCQEEEKKTRTEDLD